MAATNFTPIILYHTTTASAAPTAGNLNNGELAINITDGKLFYKDNGGTVQVIATKGTGTIGGSTTQVQYNNAGALAGSANFTFNGTTATINTLNLTNALGTAYGGTALTTYTQGDLVYASAANTLAKLGIGANTYILTSTGSVPQWSAPSAVTVATANNLAGGAAGSVPYQSGASTTTFLSIGTQNQVLTSTGSAPQWSSGLTLTTLATTGNTTLGDAAADNLTVNATITSNLIFTDNTYDIGASGATRPRNLYLAGLLTMGGALTVNGNTTLGDAAADTLTVNSTITSNLIFTDNTYDIGASGATRPRNLFLGNNLAVGGNETITGYLGVGAAASSSNAINIASTNLTGAYQVGLQTALVGTSAATAGVFGIYTYPATAAAAFTTASVVGLYAENAVKGAGSTITNQYGVYITDQTQGANNFGLYSGVTSGANKFNLYVGGSAANYLEGALTVNSGSSVFNESGGDNDFRVESDLNTHMLFVDGGNDAVGIGMVPLTTFGNRNSLEIGGNTVANLSLQAAIAETLYNFYINGSGQSVYSTDGPAGFQSFNNAVSAGWSFQTYPSGTAGGLAPAGTDLLALSPNGTIFNEGGADIDFRVESDSNAYAFFLDAGNSRVAINTSDTANAVFTVAGPGTSTATTAFFANVDGTYNPYLFIQNLGSAGMKVLVSSSYGGSASRLNLEVANADCLNMTPGEVAINDGSADMDFRVESDAATHMLFVDAGNNSVNINTNSPLGGTLNVNGTIYGNENHKVHYPLPYFNFGAGGISDEYWVLARRYVGTSILASGLMGRIVGSRGSTSSGNIAAYQNIIVQSAYLSNEGPLIDSQGPTPNFEAIDIISISGVEYYAARGRASGGPCDNGMWFEGMMVNNTGDTNVFSYTRASSAGVSVVTTNVATLNTWANRDTYLQAQRAGYDRQTINGTETNFNDPGLDYDFRVESDTNTHAFFVDAGNSRVGVGTATPATTFEVAGNTTLSGDAVLNFNSTSSAGSAIIRNQSTQVSVSTTATAITGAFGAGAYGAFMLVFGDNGGNTFIDTIIASNSGTPTVLSSTTVGGSPAARTYSTASNTVRVAMASGTYNISAMIFRVV